MLTLDFNVQDSLSLPEAKFLTGWSHGKEALKNGSYDTFKGSFYVNCDFYHGPGRSENSSGAHSKYPELTAPNVWPLDGVLPGFRRCFEEFCTLVIDTAVLVARQCDRYALAKIEGYEPGYLERVVRLSTTTKARLLHYFPTPMDSQSDPVASENKPNASGPENFDSWCATHVRGFDTFVQWPFESKRC